MASLWSWLWNYLCLWQNFCWLDCAEFELWYCWRAESSCLWGSFPKSFMRSLIFCCCSLVLILCLVELFLVLIIIVVQILLLEIMVPSMKLGWIFFNILLVDTGFCHLFWMYAFMIKQETVYEVFYQYLLHFPFITVLFC